MKGGPRRHVDDVVDLFVLVVGTAAITAGVVFACAGYWRWAAIDIAAGLLLHVGVALQRGGRWPW